MSKEAKITTEEIEALYVRFHADREHWHDLPEANVDPDESANRYALRRAIERERAGGATRKNWEQAYQEHWDIHAQLKPEQRAEWEAVPAEIRTLLTQISRDWFRRGWENALEELKPQSSES